MERRTNFWIAAGVLLVVHVAALFAGFLAPYDPAAQNRSQPSEPPHLAPVRLFVHGASYRVLGLFNSDLHLFGADEPARIFLLGTDEYGRDQFSRLLYGGRVSLAAALLATALSLGLAVLFGATAGFFGGWRDDLIMRAAETFLAVPWLYLLLAVRAALPLALSPQRTFLLLIVLIGAVGWAAPARLVRGIVLTAKERDYVYAARGFGASRTWLLARHILPETYPALLTQASVLAPQYILAEVTLSFFGLGISEPAASWGTMLASLRDVSLLATRWWSVAPCLVLLPVLMSYSVLSTVSHRAR